MPEGVFGFGVVPLVEFDFGVGVDGFLDVPEGAVHRSGEGLFGQTGADGFGNLERRGSRGILTTAAVGKGDVNHTLVSLNKVVFSFVATPGGGVACEQQR